MDCKNCVKEDVCKQKEVLENVKETLKRIYVGKKVTDSDVEGIMRIEDIRRIYGITVEINCNRAVKKQTEFSPGWTNANTKNL